MSNAREQILLKLQDFGISPKRSLGQNFLISETVISKIINSVEHLKPEYVVEIGPGLGALTEKLVKLTDKMSVIELDRVFSEHWRKQGLNVLEKDALDINWSEFPDNFVLVSNLPYQISSRIVVDMSVGSNPPKGMVLMFQKEVAERIVARPKNKEYGLLSVIAQSFWQIDVVTNAGMQDFYPAPQVGSRVLRFRKKADRHDKLLRDKKDIFLGLVKSAFAQRRKLLVKNLNAFNSAIDWKTTLENLKINTMARAEELSIDQFEALYEVVASRQTL